jgi:hypothetical protein
MSMTSQERLANSNATWLIKRRQRAPWTPFIINTHRRPLTTGLINEKRRVPEHESYLPSLSLSLSLSPAHASSRPQKASSINLQPNHCRVHWRVGSVACRAPGQSRRQRVMAKTTAFVSSVISPSLPVQDTSFFVLASRPGSLRASFPGHAWS